MSNKLDDLIGKFKEENNVSGVRLADALKSYLCDFTETLSNEVEKELKMSPRVVNKITNIMIDCSSKGDYMTRHMFPVVDEKEFNILSKGTDDKVVLERINSGIRKCQSENGIEMGSYRYKIPVCYIYTKTTKKQLDDLIQNGKFKLEVTDKNGEKYILDYYLIWSDAAISKCKKMWRLTKLYKDENPIVFAPYAKRLFRIDVDVEELISIKGIEIETIDFKLEENGLSEVLILNKVLVWNAKIQDLTEEINKKECGDISEKLVPVADVVHWKYYVKDLLSYQYIIPKKITWTTFRVYSLSDKEICFDFENEYLGGFERISIYDINKEEFDSEELFYPQYNMKKLSKQSRIRSLADAYYEVKKFESILPQGVHIKSVQLSMPEGKYLTEKYPANMTVYDKGRFGYKNTNRIYVVFDCNKNNLLIVDYINFILGYLTFCFPEIGWEGVL